MRIIELQKGYMAKQSHNSKGIQKAQGIVNPLHKRLFDLKEAATYLGRPVFSVRSLIWQGKVPVIKDGRKLYLDIVDMDTYIERNKERMI